MKQKLKKFIIIAAIAAFVFGGGFLGREAYNTLFEGRSEYALSRYGSTGNEVTSIQKKLKSLGYYTGSVDGIYGSKTKSAVTAFQRNCGITVDGIAGPQTLLYLGLGSSSGGSAYTDEEINLIAKVISAEARGESYEGQVAVGAVILNRVATRHSPTQ